MRSAAVWVVQGPKSVQTSNVIMCQLAGPGRSISSRMEFQHGHTGFRVSHGRVSVLGGRIERVLRRDVVYRSTLLSDLVNSCDETTNFSAPLHNDKVDVWIAYVGASNKANSSFVSQLGDMQLVQALEVCSQWDRHQQDKPCLSTAELV